MRLLDTNTGQFVDKNAEGSRYAILSHTWGKAEQTYEELKRIQQRYAGVPLGSQDRSSGGPEGGTLSSPPTEQDRGDGPHLTSTSQLVENDPQAPSATAHAPTTLGRLTQSEVEAVLRVVAETYSLASPSSPPALSDLSVPVLDPQSTPLPQSIWEDPELSPKIRDACRVAREKGYRYLWIDSCCIDKSSSSELSEAINSMYKWYSLAAVCYAYLADVSVGEDHHAKDSAFRNSRWFTRGWTLQELIAPFHVEFFSKDWRPIASKHILFELVESVTKIDHKALLHLEPLDTFSVAQRLSWAANRQTARVEDRAYSLLGIFDINMPTLYGESDRAFRRLQEQIIQRIPDRSVFAWGDPPGGSLGVPTAVPNRNTIIRGQAARYIDGNLFATSPDNFKHCAGIRIPRHDATGSQIPSSSLAGSPIQAHDMEYTFTPHGIRTQFLMIHLTRDLLLHAIPQAKRVGLEFHSPVDDRWYLAILGCELHGERTGHLLGRVCYIPPSKSGASFVYPGCIRVKLRENASELLRLHDFFPLSLETLKRYRWRTKLKTVHIPHPDHYDTILLSGLRERPYAAIKLVLLKETRDTLRSQGYSANLHEYPDSDLGDQIMHKLTLAHLEDYHTICVEFRHELGNDGKRFRINAQVKVLPGSRVQVDSALEGSGQPDSDCHTVHLSDSIPWATEQYYRNVQLSVAGAGTLTMRLRLDFVGKGFYNIYVDVLGVPPTPSEPVVRIEKQKGKGYRVYLGVLVFRRSRWTLAPGLGGGTGRTYDMIK